ncbi:uncharacterized protein LOC133289265 [Gastrolobium bilobum]|uniref:uncharacterized protein LOC133289265 n=1 Tax=Gastrolobium bilobum TaxID=150636 RepID=UPI002AB1EB1E|nr:uncharacterized protein LOC133289265 [Gastrolobium bilobum]
MSFEDQGYGYNSEELKTPPSSGDEEVEREVFPKFNEENTFGHVQHELGMEFVSLEHFKNGVKDYNISLGRQFKWVKNDKLRARAKCSNENCYYGGQLLSAVGEDANKSFYVIAFAMGLIPALQEVMPSAHHRFCVQHVWKNFFKQWKDKAIRGIVWEAARCTTVPQFQRTMQKLKELNEDAWTYLHKIDPSCWVKAYFSHWPKCDNITNNMAEVWNAKIIGYRSKLIVSLCEELRCYIMSRMAAHQRIIGIVRGKIAPSKNFKQFLDPNMDREFGLTGLPCEHAIAALCHKNEPAELYVHQWLTVDALHATYAHTLNPVNSDKYCPASSEPKPIPPPLKRPISRPKKHRKKDPTEEHDSNTKKLKRTYAAKCAKCCKEDLM